MDYEDTLKVALHHVESAWCAMMAAESMAPGRLQEIERESDAKALDEIRNSILYALNPER